MSAEKCPVDHGSQSKCPVDHTTRSTWGGILSNDSSSSTSSPDPNTSSAPTLPTDREVSSIPRTDGSKWVYPSQAQFYAAMARKQHNPRETDMPVVVPIHNAVNERAWMELMSWENGRGGEACGGVKLVSFKGRPGDISLKARWRSLLGYQKPFDRHDWIVDRCGTRMRYIIDFYSGRSTPGSNAMSFFLDVRPAIDNWEGVSMRAGRFWDKWIGSLFTRSSPSPVSSPDTSAPPR